MPRHTRDFSSQRARDLMLARNLTDRQLGADIGAPRQSICYIVNGHQERRNGKIFRRLKARLEELGHDDIVQALEAVTPRSKQARREVRVV